MHPSDEQPGNESFPPEFESSAGLPTQRLSLSPEEFAGRAGTGQPAADNTTWRVAFKIFKSKWRSWEDLFKEAAAFATSVGPERLITIAHSADEGTGVITVWFWADWNEG